MELIPFKNLAPHEVRKLIQKSNLEPHNKNLSHYLLGGLWQENRFKDFYDLLPELCPNHLALSLRLHTKSLMRQCLSDKGGPLKKLISVAIAYAAFLRESESKALLALLQKMVLTNNKESIVKYHSLLLNLQSELKIAQQAQNPKTLEPQLLLPPDIATKLKLEKNIETILTAAHSPNARYYQSEGYLLLLAECGYWAEIDFKNFKSPNLLLMMELTCLYCFQNQPKELNNRLMPYTKSILEVPKYQLMLIRILSLPLIKVAQADLDSNLFKTDQVHNFQILGEVSNFLLGLFESAKATPTGTELHLVCVEYLYYLSLYQQMFGHSPKQIALNWLKVIDLSSQLMPKFNTPAIRTRLELIKTQAETAVVPKLINHIEIEGFAEQLVQIVSNKKSPRAKDQLISIADEFLETNWDNRTILSKDLVCCKTLNSTLSQLPSQKTRIKKLNTLEQKIRKYLA